MKKYRLSVSKLNRLMDELAEKEITIFRFSFFGGWHWSWTDAKKPKKPRTMLTPDEIETTFDTYGEALIDAAKKNIWI
jgi:hypothetical protein